MPIALMTPTFIAVGVSGGVELTGGFNITISGVFVGLIIQLERSFNNGVTWFPVSKDASGVAITFTTPVSLSGYEYESGVQYRFNCTGLTSGSALCRLSR